MTHVMLFVCAHRDTQDGKHIEFQRLIFFFYSNYFFFSHTNARILLLLIFFSFVVLVVFMVFVLFSSLHHEFARRILKNCVSFVLTAYIYS